MKKAVILLSGGLDSTTTLYFARDKKYKCHALIFDYGQRHKKEILSAGRIARQAKVPVKLLKISLPWKGSSLLDKKKKLRLSDKGIPATYVPARNLIFLSYAVSYAEAIGAEAVFIGANVIDYSGYPDCRPGFLKEFQKTVRIGTKAGVTGKKIIIKAPLINKSKVEIIRLAQKLGAPIDLTWSCYAGGAKPCGKCDSCRLRAKGFREMSLRRPQ